MSDVSDEVRRVVAARAGWRCEYCLSPADYSSDPLSIEHVRPRSLEGTSDLENLAFACQGCNGHKYIATEAADPVTGETVPLYHPRRDKWQQHFAWSADYIVILGITPIGRATVEKLQLNRLGVRNLRRVLMLIGVHPPRHSN